MDNFNPPSSAPIDPAAEDEAELRALAGPLFAALEHSAMAVAATNPRLPDNPIVFVNAAFVTLTGYTAAEAVGRNGRFLQGGGGGGPAALDAFAAPPWDGQTRQNEVVSFRKDGARFWNSLSWTPLPDSAGETRFVLVTMIDASARRDAEFTAKALEASKLAFDDSLRPASSTLWHAGVAGTWKWNIGANSIVGDARFASLCGLAIDKASEGISPADFFSVIHPQDRTRIRLAVGGMLRGAEVFAKEYRLLPGNGAIVWVQARGRTYRDGRHQPTDFIGAMVDITDRKRSEEQLGIAQAAGGIGTFEYVQGYGTASVSLQFCKLLGLYPAQHLPVRTINSMVWPDDPPLLDMVSDFSAGIPNAAELRITRADDGEVRWLVRKGEYLRDAETSIPRFSGVVYDVTDAKRDQESLRALNDALETLVETRTQEKERIWRVSRDILGVADSRGTLLSTNPAWTSILGQDSNGVIGQSLEQLAAEEARPKVRAALERAATGEPASFEGQFQTHAGGYRKLDWAIAPFDGLLYCVGRDVTDQREQAEDFIRTQEQLRQSQKLEMIGQLTGGIAHDFNNLLGIVRLNLELLQDRISGDEESGEMASMALRAIDRGASLTHQLLAYARQQPLEPKTVDVEALLSETAALLARTLGEAIEMKVAMAADIWKTRIDPHQLENALLNLGVNALHAMPDGGKLIIEASNKVLDETYVEQNPGVLPGDYVRVAVTDTGTGMPKNILDRVLEPFFTTKPVGKGSGLGLSMVHGFAKQSGGHLKIYSEPGHGTTVNLYMPRAPDAAEPGPPAVSLEIPASRSGEVVLVVEDDPALRRLTLRILRGLGYRTIEAEDGPGACILMDEIGRIDLLLTDVVLPNGMSGAELARQARARLPGLKVLYMSGYPRDPAFRGQASEHTEHLLSKPFAKAELGEMVRKVLDERNAG